jgi:hypothetical protein
MNAYHKVPSTSKTIPFNGGALLFASGIAPGFSGANLRALTVTDVISRLII